MKNNIISSVSMILAMVLTFMLPSNVFGQYMGSGSYSEGYGPYGMRGQDPEEILQYGQDMMRYGFHESGMREGSSKYPGYTGNLSGETIKELNAEQKAFIVATEDLRQTIYEKELYLKAELSKKAPDAATALGFQDTISEAKGKFEKKMIEHLIRMKKINLTAKRK